VNSVATPGKTRSIVRRKGLQPRKTRGQNFLVDANIVRNIVRASGLGPADMVVEIGPGLGALTQELAERAGMVIAVEIDRELLSSLKETLAGITNVKLVEADALKVNFDSLVARYATEDGGRLPTYKVVANLPYYITTPLLMHLLLNRFNISEMILMVQAEVGYRMLAAPGNKEYGALSVVVQYFSQPTRLFKVPPTVFYPRPRVDSLVVKLTLRPYQQIKDLDEDLFFLVVRTAFNQRRKTLLNALAKLDLPKEILAQALQGAGIDPRWRGETLNIAQFAALTTALQRYWERR